MNIIISSLEPLEVRAAGGYEEVLDVDEIKLFISKTIQNPDDILVTVSEALADKPHYKIDIIKQQGLEKQDYYGYRLALRKPLPSSANNFNFFFNEQPWISETQFNLQSKEILTDEHNPILIVGRKISSVNTEIVAQDAHSQQFQFYLKKKYDGISFVDASKKIFIDYIPVDGKKYDGTPLDGSFLSYEITPNMIEEVPAPLGQVGEWLLLKWDLPYEVTRLAGTVKYAVSVVAQSENNRDYTWQTLPSSFTVSANLGFRPMAVNTPEDHNVLSQIQEDIVVLKEDVSGLEWLTGYQSNADPEDDKEIYLNGGGAPLEDEQ